MDEISGKFMTMMMTLVGGHYNDCDNDGEDENQDEDNVCNDGSDPPE